MNRLQLVHRSDCVTKLLVSVILFTLHINILKLDNSVKTIFKIPIRKYSYVQLGWYFWKMFKISEIRVLAYYSNTKKYFLMLPVLSKLNRIRVDNKLIVIFQVFWKFLEYFFLVFVHFLLFHITAANLVSSDSSCQSSDFTLNAKIIETGKWLISLRLCCTTHCSVSSIRSNFELFIP